MKRSLVLFLAVILLAGLLSACAKQNVSGIGTLELETKEDGIGKLGGNDGDDGDDNPDVPTIPDNNDPTQAPTEPPTQAPTQTPTPSGELTTESYDNEYFSMTIPSGWKVEYLYNDSSSFLVEVHNPANPDMLLLYYVRLEPFFVSQAARDTWTQQVDSRYASAPLMSEPSAANTLSLWEQCIVFQNAVGEQRPFPSLSNISIINANTYEGPCAQYGAIESEVLASCTGPGGGSCGVYLCNAILLNDMSQQTTAEANYYSAYFNYVVVAPADSWEANYPTLYSCISSLQVKDTGSSSGIIAPNGITGAKLPAPSSGLKLQ